MSRRCCWTALVKKNGTLNLLFNVTLFQLILQSYLVTITSSNEAEEGPSEVCPLAHYDNLTRSEFPLSESFLSVSCFLCTFCHDIEAQSCHRKETVSIPLYIPLVEFGIPGTFLPQEFVAQIKYNESCSLKVWKWLEKSNTHTHIITKRYEMNVNTDVFECRSNEDCVRLPYITKEVDSKLDITSPVISYTIKVSADQTVSIARSGSGRVLSTTKSSQFVVKLPISCSYDDFSAVKVSYSTERLINSIIAVPCSPGGYFIDPRTGTLAKGDDYAVHYLLRTFGNQETLSRSRNLFYENPYKYDNFTFASDGAIFLKEILSPLYISPGGFVKTKEEIWKHLGGEPERKEKDVKKEEDAETFEWIPGKSNIGISVICANIIGNVLAILIPFFATPLICRE